MAIATFASMADAEAVDVTFLKPLGGEVSLRLLVDSGFTGQSCFVLPRDANDIAHAVAPGAQAAGALQGMQQRVIVACRIEALAFQVTTIAILADVSGLALPDGIQGLVGLRFLRYFRRWGAEQMDDNAWRFFLSTDPT